MKKIYLVGLAFALLTASCDDVLEKTSSTQLPTIDAISSVADLTNAVNGVYEQQATEVGSYGAEFTLLADLRSGDFQSIYHGESCRAPCIVTKQVKTMRWFIVSINYSTIV